ncbi:hypothetical protein [Heyndrickxia sporothermodurans]|uniref:hypothetical protein n=2 Tax=Heyndrickxia sporothermodurans TaxID=46224 RepID=UPI0035D79BF4
MHKSVRYRKEKQRNLPASNGFEHMGTEIRFLIYPQRTDSSTWEGNGVHHLPASNRFVHLELGFLPPSSRITQICKIREGKTGTSMPAWMNPEDTSRKKKKAHLTCTKHLSTGFLSVMK